MSCFVSIKTTCFYPRTERFFLQYRPKKLVLREPLKDNSSKKAHAYSSSLQSVTSNLQSKLSSSDILLRTRLGFLSWANNLINREASIFDKGCGR